MTPDDRARIRAALEAATPGPWTLAKFNPCVFGPDLLPDGTDDGGLFTVADLEGRYNANRNAHLIANAPTWLASLLDALEEAEKARTAYAAYGDAAEARCDEQRQRADAAEREVRTLQREKADGRAQVQRLIEAGDEARAQARAAEARVKDLRGRVDYMDEQDAKATERRMGLEAEVARLQERVRELEERYHQYEGKPCPLTKVMAAGHDRIAALEQENARLKDRLSVYEDADPGSCVHCQRRSHLEAQLNGMREACNTSAARP